jgi:hypothetical protein
MQRMHAPDREAKLAGIDQTSEINYTLSGLLLPLKLYKYKD